MTQTDASELLVRKAAEAVHAADPAAFLVPSRVVRRVIRAEHELVGLGINVPHRKSYVVDAETLLTLVERDELGVERASEVPSPAILIAQPGDERLASLTLSELLRRSWSLLFHARVDVTLLQLAKSGKLTASMVRERVDRIGQVEFDEMHAVVKQEGFLLTHEDPLHVYVEAAAVFLELRYFRPDWLPAWFPALDDFDRVEAVFATDLDVPGLLERARPEGAPDRNAPAKPQKDVVPAPRSPVSSRQRLTNSAVQFAAEGSQNERVYYRCQRRARKAAEHGNSVKSAVWRLKAAKHGRRENADDASSAAYAEIDNLTRRLQVALEFDDAEAGLWRESLAALLANSLDGFWNADKRVLHDLQKVCVDHERAISKVDMGGWLLSFGKKPLRRTLPNQREVLMSKHLRQATGRLATLRMSSEEREQLSHLLHAAAESAEHQLRERLRPLVSQALDEVGIEPRNLPERVAREKVVDELLDAVVRHGFANMSMFRDSLSRNRLKLPDLSGPKELWRGDWLLRADRRLSELLDGVYRRGEIYLRGLQKASSLAFGTAPGRFLTRFVAIPFGGALILLEGSKHICDKVAGVDTHAAAEAEAAGHVAQQATHLMSWFNPQTHPLGFWGGILVVGAFLIGLIHVRAFRQAVGRVLFSVWSLLRVLVVALPKWLWQFSSMRLLFANRVAKWLRDKLVYPAIIAALCWLMLPVFGVDERFRLGVVAAVFLGLAAFFGSRVGRDLEERATERVHGTWRRVQKHVFVALFEATVNFFKRLLEGVERVLYAVDEWLRFKSGENSVTLVVKGVLGLVWGVFAFVLRFVVNLLVEPQVNPIKHFPVVTVSHKIILPLGLPGGPLSQLIRPLFDAPETANAVAGSVVFLIPGIFGFLVWECKENWKLYAANRARRLKPVTVGSHGESTVRLMKPGFHSGTVPKLFAKLRRAERHRDPARRLRGRVKYRAKLHHVVEEVRHFADRELVRLLAESRQFAGLNVEVGFVQVASNSVRVELLCTDLSDLSLVLAFQEQSGCLLASLLRPGWTVELDDDRRRTLWLALAGFYKMAGVDVVREQLQSCFDRGLPPYDFNERGLVVWPGRGYEDEVRFDLSQRPYLRPRPRSVAREYDLPTLPASRALYLENEVEWDQWVAAWSAEQADGKQPPLFAEDVRLLPQLPARF